jgi:hypothetical protein
MLTLNTHPVLNPHNSPVEVSLLYEDSSGLYLRTSTIVTGNLHQTLHHTQRFLGHQREGVALVNDLHLFHLNSSWYLFTLEDYTLIINPSYPLDLKWTQQYLPRGYIAGVTPSNAFWVAHLPAPACLEYRAENCSGTLPLDPAALSQNPLDTYLSQLLEAHLESL